MFSYALIDNGKTVNGGSERNGYDFEFFKYFLWSLPNDLFSTKFYTAFFLTYHFPFQSILIFPYSLPRIHLFQDLVTINFLQLFIPILKSPLLLPFPSIPLIYFLFFTDPSKNDVQFLIIFFFFFLHFLLLVFYVWAKKLVHFFYCFCCFCFPSWPHFYTK